ncbi:MAG: AraC family transcriptional regulator [Candidatus Limiplasma sp.]|nr:AraC family transcriptional regulator [Candidatus Limiplasma sp.]
MQQPVRWEDEHYLSRNRIVLTAKQLQVPGVKVFAHHVMTCAISPLAPHYHENCFEFTVIFDGVFSFHTDSQTYKVSGGNTFIAYPNEVHSTDEIPLSHGEFYWIQLNISSSRDFLFLDEQAAECLIQKLYQMRHHTVKIRDKQHLDLIKAAFKLTTTPGSQYLISGYLVLFFNLLAENAAASAPSLSWNIYRAVNYITDHVAQEITLDELARCSCLSVSQFKSRFKQETGVSPRSYINMHKVELAKDMLRGGKSITETAFLLNFNTSSYFTAVFKKYTFFTPSDFMKQRT